MNTTKPLLLLSILLLLFTACSTKPPLSVQEYRSYFFQSKDGVLEGYETYMLEKSVKEAHEVLHTFVATYQEEEYDLDRFYDAKLLKKVHRLELHIKDGSSFKLLLDIYRNSETSVKVDFYHIDKKDTKLKELLERLLKN